MHTKPPLFILTLLPILLLFLLSTSASTTPPSHPTTTASQPHPATPTLQQPPLPPPLPKRCRTCPQNNTVGLTCFKNTLCIPLSLLCTLLPSSTNTSLPSLPTTTPSSPCPDLPSIQLPRAGATNPTPDPGSVICNPNTNLCQDPTFLPLPAPGVGSIRRDTSSSCLKGAFFSLYPSSSEVGDAGASESGNEGVQQKYIQSCIVSTPLPSNSKSNNNNSGGQPPCQDWEYRVGDSCLLRLCGGPPSSQELSCVLPYTCRKPTPSSSSPDTTTSPYGVCSNSTNPNPDDTDSSASPQSSRSKKDLLFNLLIVLCSLVGLTAILFLLHHLRKRHLQRQGRYLPWTRQDKIHFFQALICRREMGKLWEERRERLRVLQERELKWKPTTSGGGGQRRREGSGEGGSQESVAMYTLHSGTTTSTQSRSTRALPQQSSSSSSIPSPTVTTTTPTTTPIHPTIPPPIYLLPSTTSSPSDNNRRPISHTDSESTDTSSSSQAIMMTHQSLRHRPVLDIFARRWQQQQQQFQLQQQQQQQQQQQPQDGQQQGNGAREEVEPLPLYHQGPDLPAYRVRSPEPVQEPTPQDQEHEQSRNQSLAS